MIHSAAKKPVANLCLPPAKGLRIGLFGGSFNPAHAGHHHVALTALNRLGLNAIWWLVSPQNPLKFKHEMGTLQERMTSARSFVQHPRFRLYGFEASLGLRYSAETIALLKHRHPHTHFVWLIGADNLFTLHHWYYGLELFYQIPIAVLAREPYAIRALRSQAALRFNHARLPAHQAKRLALRKPPAWIMLHERHNPISSTQLRLQNYSING